MNIPPPYSTVLDEWAHLERERYGEVLGYQLCSRQMEIFNAMRSGANHKGSLVSL